MNMVVTIAMLFTMMFEYRVMMFWWWWTCPAAVLNMSRKSTWCVSVVFGRGCLVLHDYHVTCCCLCDVLLEIHFLLLITWCYGCLNPRVSRTQKIWTGLASCTVPLGLDQWEHFVLSPKTLSFVKWHPELRNCHADLCLTMHLFMFCSNYISTSTIHI